MTQLGFFLGLNAAQRGNSGLSISAGNGVVTVGNVTAGASEITVEIIDTTPNAFEGTYAVDLADMSDGIENLAVPLITPTTATPGDTLTGTPALWLYDPEAYEAASKTFSPTRQWHLDGSPISGATGLTYVAADAGSYTLVETVEKPDGSFEAATSLARIVEGTVTLTSELMDNRWIDLSGIIPDSQKLLIVIGLDDAIATPGADQALLANTTETLEADRKLDLQLNANTNANPQFIVRSPTTGLGMSYVNTEFLDAIPGKMTLFAFFNNDPYDGDAVYVQGATRLKNYYNRAAAKFADLPDNVSLNSELHFNRSFTGMPALAAGTKLRFLWISTILPEPSADTLLAMAAAIRPQFYDTSGSAPNFVVSDVPIQFDGTVTMTVDGSPVTIRPELFLAGDKFGQYDDGGTKRLKNRGSGPDPVLIGDWFA